MKNSLINQKTSEIFIIIFSAKENTSHYIIEFKCFLFSQLHLQQYFMPFCAEENMSLCKRNLIYCIFHNNIQNNIFAIN